MRELTARGREMRRDGGEGGSGEKKEGGRGDLKTHLNPPNFQTLGF